MKSPRCTRAAAVLPLFLFLCRTAGAASWIPEGVPPTGVAEKLRALSGLSRDFVGRGCRGEVARLQRQTFFRERVFEGPEQRKGKEAVFAFLKGDFSGAGALLKNQKGRRTAHSQLLLAAHVDFAEGRYANALRGYSSLAGVSRKAFPDADLAAVMAGFCQLRVGGSPEGALADLVAARKGKFAKGKLAKEALLDLAWGLFLLGRVDEAAAVCRKIYRRLKKEPRLFYLYGLVLVRQGKAAEARGAFAKSIDLGANSPMASAAYASACLQSKGNERSAVREMIAAEELWAGDEGAKAADPRWFNRRIEDVVQAGGQVGRWRLAKAHALFKRAGKSKDPATRTLATEGLADVALLAGRVADALPLYRQVLGENALAVPARIKAVLALLLSARIDEAFSLYLEGVDLTAVPCAYRSWALLQAEHRELFAALRDCFALYLYEAQKRIKEDFNDLTAHKTAGAVFYALHFYDRALREAAVVRRKAGQDVGGLRLWAMALWRDAQYGRRGLKQGQLKEAAEALGRAVEAQPAPALDYVLAKIHGILGDVALERAHLKRALGRKAEAPTILFPLATDAKARKAFAEAKNLLLRLFRVEYASRTSAVARQRYQEVAVLLGKAGGKGGSR